MQSRAALPPYYLHFKHTLDVWQYRGLTPLDRFTQAGSIVAIRHVTYHSDGCEPVQTNLPASGLHTTEESATKLGSAICPESAPPGW